GLRRLAEAGQRRDQGEGAMAALAFGGHQARSGLEGAQQEDIERLCEGEAQQETDAEGGDADDQPLAQFDQVVEQRSARGLDLALVVVGDAHAFFSSGSEEVSGSAASGSATVWVPA